MRNADRLIFIAIAAAALGACHRDKPPPEQNIVIDNEVDPNAEMETLPADESSATPSNELVNGDDDADVNGLDGSTNKD
jgi:hypothetical protein